MKKSMYCLALGAVMVMGAGTAAALPQVTLSEDCTYANTFEGVAPTLLVILGPGGLDIPGVPTDWTLCDLDGDDLPDQQQLMLLGAVLCAGDSTVVGQYNANLAAYAATLDDVGSLFAEFAEAAATMNTTGIDVATWLDTPQAPLGGATPRMVLPAPNVAQIEVVAGGLVMAAAELNAVLPEYNMYLGVLAGLADAIAGIGGMSSEANLWITTVINGVLVNAIQDPDIVDPLTQLRDGCQLLAGAVPIPPMTAPLQAELSATAAALNALLGNIASNSGLPAFAVYGAGAKTVAEPFSGLGDYDGNGDDNATTYAKVGGGAAFVAAASGANPFYEGAAGLPVASGLGLALLTAACGLGGMAARRRK